MTERAVGCSVRTPRSIHHCGSRADKWPPAARALFCCTHHEERGAHFDGGARRSCVSEINAHLTGAKKSWEEEEEGDAATAESNKTDE